ncbi:MAG TPA: sugar transferase, partial [Pseudolysinimonas sp.]|nr:sugar transferase [Pseudolysinimonas sp.]
LLLLAGIVALAVKWDSPGPAIFKQRRVGKGGRPFTTYKFRTMVVDAEARLAELRAQADAGNDILFKMRDDPRITPLGKLLRRYSIDELPQLFNVFLGEMSLIGPRPPLASEVEEYEHHVHRRFLVKPGITGLWQVNGRSNLSWEESVRLDLYYVENWTLTGDLAILFRTAQAVVGRDGAY